MTYDTYAPTPELVAARRRLDEATENLRREIVRMQETLAKLARILEEAK